MSFFHHIEDMEVELAAILSFSESRFYADRRSAQLGRDATQAAD